MDFKETAADGGFSEKEYFSSKINDVALLLAHTLYVSVPASKITFYNPRGLKRCTCYVHL